MFSSNRATELALAVAATLIVVSVVVALVDLYRGTPGRTTTVTVCTGGDELTGEGGICELVPSTIKEF